MNTQAPMRMHLKRTKTSTAPESVPARIVKIELSEPLPRIDAFDTPLFLKTRRLYQRAIAYIYLHTQPIGAVEFEFPDQEGVSEQHCAELIWQYLSIQINEHLFSDGLPQITALGIEGIFSLTKPACVVKQEGFLQTAPFVSVIVPTHDRPDDLRACLPHLLSLHYPCYEIIVVDNAPSTTETADLLQEYTSYGERIRYVREDRPGTSWARNAGIALARGEVIAFTDDDVEVDQNWLLALVMAFGRSDTIGCVTGQVQPLELETPAQYWCEENAGLYWFQAENDPQKRFVRRSFHRSERHIHLYRVGLFGCGANMAFRAEVLRRIDDFDPSLGGRGPSRCGQDIAAFFSTLMAGYTVLYEPSALIYHLHRRSYEALRKQFYNYGVGMTAYLTKNVFEHPRLLFDLLTKVPYELFIKRPDIINIPTSGYPKDLKQVNWQGMLYGPLAYIQSRQEARRDGRIYPTWRERLLLTFSKGKRSHAPFLVAMDENK